jgi:hypothetical protein
LRILIGKKPDDLLSSVKADAVVLTTTSHLDSVASQIIQCLEAGLNVVFTCEELSFPWERHPEPTQKLDNLAKEHGKTVVGTVAVTVNTIPRAVEAPPGLVVMKDLPPPKSVQ